jgi:hypothetical protein
MASGSDTRAPDGPQAGSATRAGLSGGSATRVTGGVVTTGKTPPPKKAASGDDGKKSGLLEALKDLNRQRNE